MRVQDYIGICGHEGPTLGNLTLRELHDCIILFKEQLTLGITLPKKLVHSVRVAEDHIKKVKLIPLTYVVP